MRKIREVLRLRWEQGLSHRQIVTSCKLGQGTVGEYLRRALATGLTWPLPDGLTDDVLERQLFPLPVTVPSAERPLPDWAVVHRELRRKGVTLLLLWEEYQAGDPHAFRYSRFCERYQAWRQAAEPRMHQTHRAGEKLFVDYAGLTAPVTDRTTGKIRQVQIFVATLGASSYTYAEATESQTLPDWLASHVRAFAFFGGVPELVVPDNLKAGVTSACYYEPGLTLAYEDVDFRHPRGLDRAQFLALCSCAWLHSRDNLLITGPTGVGKTFLACVLAQKACREGYTVLYARTGRLLGELTLARVEGTYPPRLAALARVDLLVLDDWGLAPWTAEQRRDLWEILDDRYERHSTLVTSQLPVDHWYAALGNPTLADAILDRLVHNAHQLSLQGESLRKQRSPTAGSPDGTSQAA